MKINTVTVTRELTAQVQQKLVAGCTIQTAGYLEYVTVDGKDYYNFAKFTRADKTTKTLTFKTRKELCDYLRDQL